jgi:hypothetical protein
MRGSLLFALTFPVATGVCLAADAPPPVYGRSIQIDPGYPYYRDRSPESIAAEVRANGYGIVHYIVTADSSIDAALVAALHRERIGVWYTTFGNGTYSRKDLPAGWESWKMVTRTELSGGSLNDGYTRLCLNNPHYRAWKKAQIAKALRAVPFDGIDIAEPHWPEYPGFESPAYGCFCPRCLAAFRKMFPGEDALPDILHADSPRSPGRNPALWKRWLEFRRTSLTDFLNDLVNGKGGIRQTAPKVKVCTWTLALAERDGLRRVLEDSGEDAGEIARVVRPDLHCFQTHWPDWLRADLPPTYVEGYKPFIVQIREAAPKLPLMIQADTGSKKQNRRSWKWIKAFEAACARLGVESTTFYEYHIGEYMFANPPRIAEVRRTQDGVELRFTKRLDPQVADEAARYSISHGRITGVRADGSVVRLSLAGLQHSEKSAITVRGIADDPTRRLANDSPAAVLDSQTVEFRY